MDVQVTKRNEAVIVSLSGRLDFENVLSLKRMCAAGQAPDAMIFDLKRLSFVGSLGMTEFVDVIAGLVRQERRIRLCGVSSEFRRLFAAADVPLVLFLDSLEVAIQSLALAPAPGSAANLSRATEL